MEVSPHRAGIVFCAGNYYMSGYYLGISRSTDDGVTWDHDTLTIGSRGWAVAFDPTDSNRVYVAGDSAYNYPALLVSTDMGETWTQSRTGLTGALYALVAVPGSATDLYAGGTGGVFKSTDAGASWFSTGLSGLTKALVIDPDDVGTIYAGINGQGVHVSTDAGSSWTGINDGLTNPKVISLDLRPGAEPVLFAGTEGGAVFRTDLYTGTAGRPRTGPARSGSAPTLVRSVLRLPGREPAVLLDATGRRLLVLAPGDNDIRALPAGLYFVRPVDPGDRTIRKVVVQ